MRKSTNNCYLLVYRVIVDQVTLQKTSELLQRKVYYSLVDFDNHLDNISLDWKNESLNKQINDAHFNEKKKIIKIRLYYKKFNQDFYNDMNFNWYILRTMLE